MLQPSCHDQGKEGEFVPLPSEDAILACLARYFDNGNSRLALGRGDDCAVLSGGKALCVSSDMFLENAHFRRSYFEPEETGYKALAINISDLAGFGARPVAFNLCLGLPVWVDMAWLDRFFAGMAELAKKQRISLAGGDLSRCGLLCIAITVFGENNDDCDFLKRGGAMPGDALFVVGSLGLARVGLRELEAKGRSAMREWPAACAAHLRPEPQTGAGLMLARAGYNARPPALMDLSDGLCRDLPRLLGQSGELGSHSRALGAELKIRPNMLHEEVVRHAQLNSEDPVLEVMKGGEDYCLLGACAPAMLPALQTAIPNFFRIGEITDSGHIGHDGKILSANFGFDHFETENNLPPK